MGGPSFQCNHPAGTHKRTAGGRLPNGHWATEDFTAFPGDLNVHIAIGATMARTGSPKPVPKARPAEDAPRVMPDASSYGPKLPENHHPAESGPGSVAPSGADVFKSPGRPSPVEFRGFATTGSAPGSAAPSAPDSESPAYRPFVEPRAVRAATRASTSSSHELEANRAAAFEARREARAPVLPVVPESPDLTPEEMDAMESQVASLVASAHGGVSSRREPNTPVGEWFTVPSSRAKHLPPSVRGLPEGEYCVEIDAAEAKALLFDSHHGGASDPTHAHVSLFACLAAADETPLNHRQAARIGGKWIAAELKELGNHARNGSWERVLGSDVPAGRHTHKLVWVFKVKRDGTAKARLCVQGCTMVPGQDYDQVFANTLRSSSVRALFAYAARYACSVRSVDWVAAYLQGELLEGEVIYCRMPAGYEQFDDKGQPYFLKIVRPIYGIPQAGRRFQRSIFPWLRKQGMCQLDDSDSSVWVYRPNGCPSPEFLTQGPNAPVTAPATEAPNGETPSVVAVAERMEAALAAYHRDTEASERLILGIYVDNLQIIHSADMSDTSSKMCSFMKAIQHDWDVEDEGPMVDLLGIEIQYNPDGSITLHQKKYIDKLTSEFLPDGIPSTIPKNCLPYSTRIMQIVADASHLRVANGGKCMHPELREEYQRRLGCVMYLANSTRPDIAYPIGMHCRNMSSPTPELLHELNYVFVYLSRNASVGLTFETKPTPAHGYTDSSLEEGKSTSGYMVCWQGAPVSWGSTKQKSTALSSCEAEIYALSEGAKDMVYFRKFLSGLGEDMTAPSNCSTDNKGAADLSYNPEHHKRSKHIERRHFYIRDMVEAMELRVPLVGTADNYADMLTKPLPPNVFYPLRKRIMNLPREPRS